MTHGEERYEEDLEVGDRFQQASRAAGRHIGRRQEPNGRWTVGFDDEEVSGLSRSQTHELAALLVTFAQRVERMAQKDPDERLEIMQGL